MSVVEWRPVEGWPYEVSNTGLVRRTSRGRTLIAESARVALKPGNGGRGHQFVFLHDNPRCTRFYVHRLVATAFLAAPVAPSLDVAHNDGNPRNNAVGNLRWATRRENLSDKLRHGTHNRGERHNLNKLSEADIVAMRAAYAAGGITYQRLSERYGVCVPHICGIIRRKKWAWLGEAA